MRIFILSLTFAAMVLSTPLAAQESLEDIPVGELPAAEVVGEVASDRISAAEMTGDWPAVSAGPDGSLWSAWVEWNGSDGDRVLVRRRTLSGTWSAAIELADGNWDHYLPAVAALPGGALVAWSSQVDGDYDLFTARVSNSGEVGEVRKLADTKHSDFHVRLIADSEGNVTAVWQSFAHLNADVYARRLSNGAWGSVYRVSTSGASDWEPSVALDSRGVAWISWDSYHAGNYDVMLASFDGKETGASIPIATGPETQFHSSVAVDSADRVWVAFDTARPNWGKEHCNRYSLRTPRWLTAQCLTSCVCIFRQDWRVSFWRR